MAYLRLRCIRCLVADRWGNLDACFGIMARIIDRERKRNQLRLYKIWECHDPSWLLEID